MRLPGSRDCGELLVFEEVRRRLHLGAPQVEGTEAIRVADIIGTVNRAGDFDGCFRPRADHLASRIRQIRDRAPNAFNEPIEVVRVDRAYFVADGHKRVSIAREAGVEFIDAQISRAPSIYELAPGVASESIDLTSREQRFREETGLMTAVPAARFAVSEQIGYPELREAIESYAYELSQRLGRLLSREEAAALWYECATARPSPPHSEHERRSCCDAAPRQISSCHCTARVASCGGPNATLRRMRRITLSPRSSTGSIPIHRPSAASSSAPAAAACPSCSPNASSNSGRSLLIEEG